MLDRTKQYKIIASSVIAVLLVAALVFFVVTVMGSSQANTTGHEVVALGPLSLLELHKVPADGGYEVSVAVRAGLMYYFAIALAVGLIVGLIRVKLSKAPIEQD